MADIRVSDVKQMTPDRAALREIAERLKTEYAYPSPSPRWYEDVERIADYVIALTAPLLVKCENCGGSGQFDEIKDDIKCDACHGKGYVERADLAAIRKRFEDAAHEPDCKYIVTLFASLSRRPRTVVEPCNCWKSTFGLDALLDLIAAQAREIAELKGKANGTL